MVSGPAHHRIGALIALLYRQLINSIHAVTQEVTQTRSQFDLPGLNTGRSVWSRLPPSRACVQHAHFRRRERSGVALSGHPFFGTTAALTVLAGGLRLDRTAA